MNKNKEKTYTITELLEWFIKYRRFTEADNIDPIGEVDFEKEFANLIYFIINNNLK